MSLLSAVSADRQRLALSAVSGVLLVLVVTWRVWRWIRHTRLPEAQSTVQPTDHAIDQREGVEPSESAQSTAGKHRSEINREHHHGHAKSSSSRSHTPQSTHDHDRHGDTEQLLHPRAQTQPNYSSTSHQIHSQRENAKHSSRILLFHDTNEEPAPVSRHHAEETGHAGREQTPSGHAGSRNGSSPRPLHDSHAHSSGQGSERDVSADDLRERLQRHAISYLELHPEDITDWEDEPKRPRDREGPRPGDIEFTGKRHRDLALQETRLRKAAFENSKRAFKMGRKAEARQLSEEGKLHDENAKRYNALAASEIFAANNPRYYSGRQLSRCDLHGLHVEEAMTYARDHLVACRAAGADKTMLIVGKGSHSQQGGARIRPAILSMLSETGGVVAGVHEKNEGCIVVEFAVGR